MMRRGAIVLLALAAAACTTLGPQLPPRPPPGPPPPPPPPPAATIVGHGAYHTRSGAHGDCAGLSIILMHDTPGYRRRVGALYGAVEGARAPIAVIKARSAKLGAGESPLAASVQCDASGNFVFRDISAGSYFIIGRVHAVTVSGGVEELAVMRHVAVVNGETRDVSLAP